MSAWHLYPALSATMPYQMALDEVLFRGMIKQRNEAQPVTPILRYYYASHPSLSVGYSHPIPDFSQFSEPVVRRITGGGLVKHGKDLIFSLIAPKETDEYFTSVRMSYLKIHEALKEAFESLGHETKFYRCDEDLPRGGDCFKHPIATDLSVSGEKIAGGAQKRSQGVMLHQESIPLKFGLKAAVFIEASRFFLEKKFEMKLLEVDMTPELVIEAGILAKEKYGADHRRAVAEV